MGDLLLLHSRRSGSKNEQAEFGHDQKHSRGSACKILFLHHDICATEINAGRNHHGSSRNPSRSSSLIKSQLPILVLVLVVQVLLASHFPSPAQAQGAVAAPELLQSRVLLQQRSSNKIDSNSNGFRALDAKSDRIDPLDHFRKYEAGYDLKSKHYWAVREQDPTCLLQVPRLWSGKVCATVGNCKCKCNCNCRIWFFFCFLEFQSLF